MAGSIQGIPLSQQWDANGDPISGGKLYLYQANTSTPTTAYDDFNLTTGHELSHPILTDSAGRIPQFFLADGEYRAYFTTSDGTAVFDVEHVLVSATVSGGGGGGGEVDEDSIFQTGDMLWLPVAGTRTGWVRANGRTIGSAASSATERANADTQALYSYLWDNFSDTLCPVATGRGASAAADFSADKAIGTLDMRGRGAFGLDDMGNTAASVLTAGTPTAAASVVGAELLTIAQANLPNVSLSSTGLVATTVLSSASNLVTTTQVSTQIQNGGSVIGPTFATTAGNIITPTAATTITGTIPLGGSGTAANKMPPGRLGSWYFRL